MSNHLPSRPPGQQPSLVSQPSRIEDDDLEKALALSRETAQIEQLQRGGEISASALEEIFRRRDAVSRRTMSNLPSSNRPIRPPQPHSIAVPIQRDLIDLEPSMNIKPVSSLYEQDLQELFGPTSATTASATTTGVSSNANDQKLLTTTAAHVPQDPWSLDLAIQSQSLPNSTKVSQKIKVTLNENVKANDISGLHHSHSGSSIASAFQAQSESHSQKQSANTGMPSSFVNYMPSSKSAWNQTQGSHTVLDGLPEFSSSLPAVCSKTNVTPTPVRPLSRKQSSNVTTSCMTSISSTTVSTSEPSGNFLQSSWQDFDLGLSAFKSPAKAAPSSAITSSKALVFDNKHNVSTTKQAFVWTGRDQSSQAPSIRVTSTLGNQCNIARESEMTSNSMDDIIREFDTLDLGPAHRKSGRQEISPPEMYPLRQSSSEGNLSSVSWMDFDPLSSTSNVTTNSSLSQADPSSLPSYDESQRNTSTTLPQVRRTPSPSCMYLPSAEAHVKKPPGRPSPPKSPVSPSRPKSPASRKSQVPPKRPKSPRPHTLHGAERPQARTKAPNRSSTWRPVSLAMGAIDSAKAERVFFGDGLFDLAEEKDEEAKAFSASIISFRSVYEYDNRTTNPGHVMSAVFQHPYSSGFESSVKIILLSSHAEHPVTFSCDVSTSVQHIISQAVYMLSEDFSDVPIEDFTLKIYGLAEYLYNDTLIGDYEYVQDCVRFERDVRLILQHKKDINKELARTIQDDQNILVTNFTQLFEHPLTTTVSKQGLVVLLEAFNSEVKKVREHVRDPSIQAHPNKVIQTVKAICATLATVEPNNITRVYEELKSTTSLHIGSTLNNLTAAVQNLMDMYCKAFDTGHTLHTKVEDLLKLPVTDIHDEFHIKIASVHRLPLRWKSSFEHFTLSCAIFYGGTPLYRTLTTKTAKITTNFFDKISFDQVLNFSLPLCKLPRETRICFTLFGTSVSNSDNKQPTRKALGWVTVPLFNFKSVMLDGSHLFGLWPDDKASPIGTCASNILQAHSVIIQVDFPKYDGDVIFPPVEKTHLLVKDYEDLDQDVKTKIRQILKKDTLARLVEHENKLIWNNRHYLHALPNALPWLLRVVESWDWSSLGDLYSLLHHWTPLEPVDALQLLHPQFADCEVRVMAVSYIQCLSDDELCDYLPQLVQALKYENYHDSALARFLIERSLTSIRVAHYLYWHLKDCVCDQQFSQRFQMVLGALLCTSGEAIRDQFQRQDEFMTKLGEVAEIVKKHKDSIRQVILHRKLEPIAQKYTKNLRLPLSPSYDVGILNVKSCSYFTSNTVPLRMVFNNADPLGEDISIMFKAGEDLRQDMLTLQMIRLMDKMWLEEGLDLKMILFRCMATGPNAGLVELVPDSETLRKIQVERGVTGSFKEDPLAEWLQKHNPTETEYQKAVDNFIYSLAGYCVATYVLGIGDRHNDNIMIKTSGHVFHIDFGKFLGNAQMFGSFKRDRTPFVLSPDMAYVINGGVKPSSRFHDFVDLCCQAFNITRRHANIFFNLFGLMLNSGILELSQVEDIKYVQNALKPSATDAEATVMFTRLIESSLGAKSTQINFFIHNLAQLKFHSASNDTGVLSFSSKIHTLANDGRISSATVFGFQKRYNPEKYYIYIIKVSREKETEPAFVFRKFSEFHELNDKITATYPKIRLPILSSKHILGRTHIQQVAEKRKGEIQAWLNSLFAMAPEVSECDLVYTFFHPLLRDERDVDLISMVKPKESALSPTQPKNGQIGGQIKLLLHYKNNALVIMIMHVKNLIRPSDGSLPDPYVKLYLLPDPGKMTKKKTKVMKKSLNPTYNELLIYNLPLCEIRSRTLQITVWDCDYLKENDFMGAAYISLNSINLTQETVEWYKLGSFHRM